MQFGDRHNKYFQMMSIIEKRDSRIWKIKNDYENRFKGQKVILQVISSESCRRFRKDAGVIFNMAVPLSKDI